MTTPGCRDAARPTWQSSPMVTFANRTSTGSDTRPTPTTHSGHRWHWHRSTWASDAPRHWDARQAPARPCAWRHNWVAREVGIRVGRHDAGAALAGLLSQRGATMTQAAWEAPAAVGSGVAESSDRRAGGFQGAIACNTCFARRPRVRPQAHRRSAGQQQTHTRSCERRITWRRRRAPGLEHLVGDVVLGIDVDGFLQDDVVLLGLGQLA